MSRASYSLREAQAEWMIELLRPNKAVGLVFSTLTFRPPEEWIQDGKRNVAYQQPWTEPGPQFGRKTIESWLQAVCQRYPGVRCIVVEERGTIGGRLHYHALFAYESRLDRDTFRTFHGWSNGWSRHECASADDAVARYVGKYLFKDGMPSWFEVYGVDD